MIRLQNEKSPSEFWRAFVFYMVSCPEKALQQNVTKDGKRRKRVR
jgi:hypothetical protein